MKRMRETGHGDPCQENQQEQRNKEKKKKLLFCFLCFRFIFVYMNQWYFSPMLLAANITKSKTRIKLNNLQWSWIMKSWRQKDVWFLSAIVSELFHVQRPWYWEAGLRTVGVFTSKNNSFYPIEDFWWYDWLLPVGHVEPPWNRNIFLFFKNYICKNEQKYKQ